MKVNATIENPKKSRRNKKDDHNILTHYRSRCANNFIMRKVKNRKNNKETDVPSLVANGKPETPAVPAPMPVEIVVSSRRREYWILEERQGFLWVAGLCLLGCFVGFGIGSGLLTGEFGNEPNTWRMTLGARVRETNRFHMFHDPLSNQDATFLASSDPSNRANAASDPLALRSDPSHPTVYAVLREAIVREKGGFVHPDLGILQPAPCGAARGIGMVRDTWQQCQVTCLPGVAKEKLALKSNETELPYKQEEILIKVPLNFQMTRSVALATLLPHISPEVQRKASIHELDDAALLVLLLAHERGVGKYSRWLPYIASLPLEPSCGYSNDLRPYMLDSVQALKGELGLDVNGWSSELLKATQYAEKIATGLARDYGNFLQHPKGMSVVENIQWALCQVASRATAGSQKHGSLRLVPLVDMVNHDANAGGFVELMGEEKLENGNFIDATEDDSGAFVVRSLRHGRRKALKVGQELLVNYNVPHYSALDWFISLGFVPPERWSQWQKLDAALPRVRRDGPFGAPEANRRGPSSVESDL